METPSNGEPSRARDANRMAMEMYWQKVLHASMRDDGRKQDARRPTRRAIELSESGRSTSGERPPVCGGPKATIPQQSRRGVRMRGAKRATSPLQQARPTRTQDDGRSSEAGLLRGLATK